MVGPDDLADWFRGRKRLIVATGNKVVEQSLKGLSVEDREALVLGRSGKLRAPTLLVGDVVLVGWNEESYAEFFPAP